MHSNELAYSYSKYNIYSIHTGMLPKYKNSYMEKETRCCRGPVIQKLIYIRVECDSAHIDRIQVTIFYYYYLFRLRFCVVPMGFPLPQFLRSTNVSVHQAPSCEYVPCVLVCVCVYAGFRCN